MIGIYKITNVVNGKIYIGQSINIKKRFIHHISASINEFNINYEKQLPRALRKYGLNNFKFEVVELCLKKELNIKEIYWIDYFDSTNNKKGYNIEKGGFLRNYYKLSENDLLLLIEDLRTSEVPTKDLALKYSISSHYIYDINIGRQRAIDGIVYPIRPITKKLYICPFCGKEKATKNSGSCGECSRELLKHVQRPDKVTLANEIINSNFVSVGRKYRVSDNAIRKWCKVYNIPKDKKGLKTWLSAHSLTG